MECFTFLFFALLLIVGIAESIKWIKDRSPRNQRRTGVTPSQENLPSDLDYLEAMVILGMAEDGVFLPDGHQVFGRIASGNQDFSDDYEDYNNDNFNDDYDQISDSEYSDHWGLG
jgi:hypothetical protein